MYLVFCFSFVLRQHVIPTKRASSDFHIVGRFFKRIFNKQTKERKVDVKGLFPITQYFFHFFFCLYYHYGKRYKFILYTSLIHLIFKFTIEFVRIKNRVKHLFSPWVLETLSFSLWVSICITYDTSVLGNDRISTSVDFSVQKLIDRHVSTSGTI